MVVKALVERCFGEKEPQERANGAYNQNGRMAMQYLLMLHSEEAGWDQMTKEQQQQGYAAYMAYSEALKKAGALLGSNRLRPSSSSTTVRVENGKSKVLDGPYVDSKEQIGGYYLIEVADLDAALSWAARCPGASHGTVEVRPVWSM
jgi:hypothetical protein